MGDSLIGELERLIAPGGGRDNTLPGVVRPAVSAAPKGWEPGVKYESERMIVQSLGVPTNVQGDPEAWRKMVEELGLQVPRGYVVRLVEAKYDPAAWHRDEMFTQYPDGDAGGSRKSAHTKSPAVTRPVWRYRFAVEPDTGQMHVDDVDSMIAEVLRKRRRPKTPIVTDTPRAINVVYADPQAGKVALLGGAAELAARVGDCYDLLDDHLSDLKKVGRAPTEATWLDGGDCIEGFNNVPSQKYTNDLTMTQQVRVHRRLSLYGLDFLAKRFSKVQAATCGSNHAQEREGKAPIGPPDNDWGIEVLSQIQDAFALNPDAYGHVSFAYPTAWRSTLSLMSGGLPIGLAHGHQLRSSDPKSVLAWWMGQTFGRQPVADARVLVTNHFHTFRAGELGRGRLHVQSPTLDNGSDWYTDLTGEESEPAMLVFSTTADGWDDLKIIRGRGEHWGRA